MEKEIQKKKKKIDTQIHPMVVDYSPKKNNSLTQNIKKE